MSIPQSFIQELLARVDVVEVIGRHVQLKKSGANYMGLCPFHGEKSPSFSVSPSKQFFHCFGCGKNGNAIGFLMEHAGMGFVDAVQDLAQGAGLQVPDERASPAERARAAEQRRQQATLSDVLEQAATAWAGQLRKSERAIDYFKGRGVSGQIAKRYGLGYAPEGWRGLASVFPEYDNPLLEQAGLVIVGEEDGKRYDRFRDRVMFPIRNVKGECIAFGGRVLGDDKPKYLNSPETPVFHKGNELYGLYEARTAMRAMGYALVTEGYMDVVALAQRGFANAVATLGTACTAEHVHKLFRFTDTVVFSFDGDTAGRRAARKALEAALPYASDTRSVKFLFLPPEHDPDSFIRVHGQDGFAREVEAAMPLSRFLPEAAREGCDMATAEGRAHMLSNARALWEALPEGALRRQLLAELAQQAQLPVQDLAALWAQPQGRAEAGRGQGGAPAGEPGRRPWRGKGADAARRGPPPRPQPARRIDHAARLLLSHMQFLEELTHEDQGLLREQPAPHGTLFLWLESRLLEHGPQPWAVLREALADQPCQRLAERLMTGSHAQTEGEERELRWELRELLNRMLVEAIKHEQIALVEQAASDPQAMERYRQLQERRLALEAPRPAAS
ncbi:DNA primase [Pulveribacter suum]|uniref:DNA primase n=1 Tax=Pulveribacter suum TaxID=2116657 RepID=A0A2P1NMN3_9BURK|nr:DNA primase [Pulveribacter suum]AVP58312.1 DNA primase [Pulveribacter suum]